MKGCFNIKYKEGVVFKRVDGDGYWHEFRCENGIIWHSSNRPICYKCNMNKEITEWEHGYAEICPSCGEGVGSAF